MTAEEAIKELKEDKSLYETEICQAGDGTPEGDLIMALDMGISSLEKQIPKKPYIQQDDRNNDCLECPSCDSFIGYEYDCRDEHYQINYCPYCGQAIDWSEEE